MTLEEALKEAVARGITHLSLHSTFSQDGKKVYWHALAAPSTPDKFVTFDDTDPVKAVMAALQKMPKAPRSKPRFDEANPPLSELPQRAVTAAVTPPSFDNHGIESSPADPLNDWLPKA